MRINSYLAKSGIASRRKAESFIIDGRVLINGRKAKLADQVTNQDKITIDGKEVILQEKKNIFFLTNR